MAPTDLRLHSYDRNIDEFNIEYNPVLCWFCGEAAFVPMKFCGRPTLYYNACRECASIISSGNLGDIYEVCKDHQSL